MKEMKQKIERIEACVVYKIQKLTLRQQKTMTYIKEISKKKNTKNFTRN